MEDVPKFPFEPNICKYDRGIFFIVKCSMSDEKQPLRYTNIFKTVQQKNPSLNIIKTYGFFCKNGSCDMEKNGNVLFRDNNHLNIIGSIELGKFIVNGNSILSVKNVE